MNAGEFLADLLMLAHAGYSLFVLGGLMMVLLGTILGWRWTRVRSFRIAHLAATMFLMVRVWIGLPCPFSVGEDVLRSGVTAVCPLGGAFHDVLHRGAFRGTNPQYFAGCATLFGVLALGAFALNGDRRGKPQTAEMT